jgi:Tol biopolymer transport system component
MVDADRGSSERFTLDPGVHFAAVWSRDGRRLAISANRTGVYDLYEQAATGAGGARLLLATPHNKAATDWSPDNRYVLYRTFDFSNAFDIWALPVGGGSPFPVVQSAADERNAQFSPDGRWIAYQSNQSGRFEIWVQSFSPAGQPASGRWQVSTGGGSHARWSADGRELFFVDMDGRLMGVPIRSTADGQAIERDEPRPLFSIVGLTFAFQGTVLPPYAVSRDGRFLIAATSTHASATPLTLILNWRPLRN